MVVKFSSCLWSNTLKMKWIHKEIFVDKFDMKLMWTGRISYVRYHKVFEFPWISETSIEALKKVESNLSMCFVPDTWILFLSTQKDVPVFALRVAEKWPDTENPKDRERKHPWNTSLHAVNSSCELLKHRQTNKRTSKTCVYKMNP